MTHNQFTVLLLSQRRKGAGVRAAVGRQCAGQPFFNKRITVVLGNVTGAEIHLAVNWAMAVVDRVRIFRVEIDGSRTLKNSLRN